jgi:hypothetical protein
VSTPRNSLEIQDLTQDRMKGGSLRPGREQCKAIVQEHFGLNMGWDGKTVYGAVAKHRGSGKDLRKGRQRSRRGHACIRICSLRRRIVEQRDCGGSLLRPRIPVRGRNDEDGDRVGIRNHTAGFDVPEFRPRESS